MPLFAERVDEETALLVGETFLKSKMHGKMDLILTPVAYANRADFSNFYVFGGENCFVIVSAEDCVKPILGYSDENPFGTDAMPENVYGWLKGYDEEIDYAVKSKFRAHEEISKEWNSLKIGEIPSVKSTAAVQPLVTAHWYQGSPCNGQCPTSSSGRAIVGCVATAMAQVMHYWKFPEFGSDSYSYYHATFGTISADFGATAYDWNNMPDRISSNSSNAQKTAVATLMYHCGVSVNMNYGVSGSGSQTSSIASSLVGFFGYDDNIRFVEKKNFTNDNWISLLKSELNAGRPMCYSAQDDNGHGGHAFVCDGYDENDKFHINWGWNSSDGYFQIGALNPSPYHFNKDQGAVIGIQPAQYLRTSYKKMRVLSGDGSQILKIKASQDMSSWSAVSNNPWITLSQTEGEGNGHLSTVSVHVEANTGTMRTGSITVSQGDSSVEVFVFQDAASECDTQNEEKSMLSYYTLTENNGNGPYPMLGNNPFFSACAEKVVATGVSKLSSVTYRYVIFDDEGSVTLKVWGADETDGNPGSVLAERTVSMKDMMSNGGLYIWGFEIPMTVDGTFYVGYETTNAISTINLFTSKDGQYENTAWVKYGAWCPATSPLGRFSSSVLATYCEATTYSVVAEANPSNGGCVTGTGDIIEYEMAALTAEAEEGYAFVNWTEDGRVVSDDSEYSFMVLEDRTLVANFVNCVPNVFEQDGNWTNPDNWSLGHVPSQSEEIAVIHANAVADADVTVEALSVKNGYALTVSEDHVFTVSDGIYNMKPSNLILENNAQLIHNTSGVQATVKKIIDGYGTGNGNWYLIASPMVSNVSAAPFATGEYDLYSYDEPTHYWMNSKDLNSGFDALANGTGYLYANNSIDGELSLPGELQPSANDVDIPLSYTSSLNTLKGFNLVGNPFPCNANVSGDIAEDFYVMDEGGSQLELATDDVVNPFEGIFVQAMGENANATFSRVENNAKGNTVSSYFDITVSEGRSEIDRARVRMGEGKGLEKFSLNENSARIYIPIEKQDYASVFVSDQKVLPLNFEPTKNGTYTLTFDLKNVDLAYLHLIDNLTGADTGILNASASYSFDAKTTDYASRFKLVFAEKKLPNESIGSDFMYYADGQLFVFGTEGNGTIQIVDIAGRVLLNENVDGFAAKSISLNPGIYVARMVCGDVVKSQKFVVE